MNKFLLAAVTGTILTGCATTPTGPSVLVLPGTSKSFAQFQQDEVNCRAYATQQIGGTVQTFADQSGLATAVLGTAVGTAIGAATGGSSGAGVGAAVGLGLGSISGAGAASQSGYDAQHRYDNAYIQCMYANGHRVPVPASLSSQYQQPGISLSKPQTIPAPPPGNPPPPPKQ